MSRLPAGAATEPALGLDLDAQPRMVEEALGRGEAGSLLIQTDPAEINRLQRLALAGNRLGIPLLFGFDVIHGLRKVNAGSAADVRISGGQARPARAIRTGDVVGWMRLALAWPRRQRQSITHRCRWPRARSSARAPERDAAWSSLAAGMRVPRHSGDHTRRPLAACTR